MLEKISKAIGFTKTEIKVTLFIISAFILGFGYKHFYRDNKITKGKVHSEFSKSGISERLLEQDNDENSNVDSVKSTNKKFDYKQEVLDFNKHNLNNIQKKVIPAEKSINLNTAAINDLINLPGIGEKTAKNILDYRNTIKKFNNVEQLQDVKGIGKIKFEQIKKYIFID